MNTADLNASGDVVEELARQTAAPIQLVKNLYEEEVKKLKAAARVDNFIDAIASQRVKMRLRGRHRTTSRH